MKIGITCAGIGHGATGSSIRAAAQAAEAAGFASFWVPDHVLLFETYPESSYAYGELFKDSPLPDPYTPLADPVIAMTWAAAATATIELGTSILILPERNPVVLAKELGTLDAFSGGRVALGVGVGWSSEEYAAIGADWKRRGKNMDEYIAVMRALWREDGASFSGETVSFQQACLNPKPLRNDVPILVGGESEAALKRVARACDGWIPYKITPENAPERIAYLKRLVAEQGRDPESIRILAPCFPASPWDYFEQMRDAGVTEFYLGVPPPAKDDPAALAAHVAELGEKFVAKLAGW